MLSEEGHADSLLRYERTYHLIQRIILIYIYIYIYIRNDGIVVKLHTVGKSKRGHRKRFSSIKLQNSLYAARNFFDVFLFQTIRQKKFRNQVEIKLQT